MSTPGTIPENWLGFSYIRSGNYDLDQNFDDAGFKQQPDHTSNDKVDFFRESFVIIEEYWYDENNLTDGATFLTALIKCAKKKAIKNKIFT